MLEPPPRFDASPIPAYRLNGDGEEFLTIRLYGPPHDSCIPSARHRRGHPFRPYRHRNRACSSGSVPAFDAALDPFDSGQAGAGTGSKACRQACADGEDQRGQARGRGCRGRSGGHGSQTGRSKICYALSQPKDRLPKNLPRDPAYLFVSFRPAENVRNEVALVLGFTAKENGPAEAAVGNASYALVTKTANAWLKNPAEEGQAIATMARSGSLTVKMQSARGSSLTDRYSLNGFGKALEHARKECAS